MCKDKIGPIDGRVFDRLTVLETFSDGSGHVKCRCSCSCGKVVVVRRSQLLGDSCHSCGCRTLDAVSKHGHACGRGSTREYRSWKAIHDRCSHPSHISWRHYGGRGIRVCDRWRDFSLFLLDMGRCPLGCSIDRIDNDGNYTPENCRWATPIEQARHTTRTRYVEAFGVRKPLSAWEEELSNATGLCRSAFRERLYRGLAPEQAFREIRDRYVVAPGDREN